MFHSDPLLFRLTYALELAKQYDWVYHVLSDSEWSGRRQIQPVGVGKQHLSAEKRAGYRF